MAKQFKGLRFANVSGGRADQFVDAAAVNSPAFDVAGSLTSTSARQRKSVPSKVSPNEYRSIGRFGSEQFPFTGQYPSDTFFFISTGSWSDLPYSISGSSFRQRSRHVMAKLTGVSQADGKILVAGGFSGSSPLSGASYFVNSNALYSSVNLPTGVSNGAGLPLSGFGNKVFVLHGGSGSAGSTETSSTFFLEWPSAGVPTWSLGSPSRASRVEHSLVQIADGRVFAPGGSSGYSEFLTSNLTWSGTLGIPLLPFDRKGYTLTLLRDNSILLLGGKNAVGGEYNAHALRFYPDSGSTPASWSVEPSMSFPRYAHQASLMNDGRVLVAGGSGAPRSNLTCFFPFPLGAAPGSEDSIDDAEIYDPVQHTWTSAGQMRFNRTRFKMLPMTTDGAGRVFVAGGSDGNAIHSSSEIFDADTISWTVVSPMRVGVRDSAAIILSSSLSGFQCLFVGGEISSSIGFSQVSSSQVFTV